LVAGGYTAAFLAGIAAIVFIPATVRDAFSSPFLPHVYCYLYDRKLIALHLGSDGIIWLPYMSRLP
jgi:hypothetical protein